jgi:hypothetical protein
MTAQECAPNENQPNDVPAGTGVTANNLTYITQQDTSFSFKQFKGGSCAIFTASPTSITAQNPGTSYNTSGSASFTVSGRSDISASGSASGGTDNIIQVVAQADIDSAKQKLAAQNTNSVKSALEQQLRSDGLYPLPATFNAGTPSITNSANVGQQATNVTVTQAVTYTMYGVKQSYLNTLIKDNIDSQINASNQGVLNNGLSSANIAVVSSSTSTEQVSLQTTAVVGPDITASQVKKEVAGKRSGDAENTIEQITGVTNVKVSLSPFYVTTVPTNTGKISVTIGKAK